VTESMRRIELFLLKTFAELFADYLLSRNFLDCFMLGAVFIQYIQGRAINRRLK
jgi:hypothetical protein